jgi:hypothetical protein
MARGDLRPAMNARTKIVLIVMVAVVAVRIVLLAVFIHGSGVTAAGVAEGHDGFEYLEYASALARLAPEEVPVDSRRHNPGWPLLLAVPSLVVPPWLAATAIVWVLAAGCVWLYSEIFRTAGGVWARGRGGPDRSGVGHGETGDDGALLWVFALGYPTLVYYQSFALVDAALIFTLLAAVLAHLRGHWWLAQVMAGLAGLVRAPALLIAPVLAADGVWREKRPVLALHLLWAMGPLAGWFFLSRYWWDATYLDFHAPVFGWPFSGISGMAQVSLVRSGYVWAATAFFLVSGIMLVRLALARRLRDPLLNVAAAFTIGFVGIHLCLRTLEYYGRTIPTFNYWDRYFVAAWPFALLAWRGRVRAWMAAGCVAGALALSVWWGLNYFEALKQHGRPRRVAGLAVAICADPA